MAGYYETQSFLRGVITGSILGSDIKKKLEDGLNHILRLESERDRYREALDRIVAKADAPRRNRTEFEVGFEAGQDSVADIARQSLESETDK